MRMVHRGILAFLLAMTTLASGVPLLAAQEASPVVATPAAVSTPDTLDANVDAQGSSDPTITFSCAVDPSGSAIINYSVNANGHGLASWAFYPNVSTEVQPPEVSWSSDDADVTPIVVYYGPLPAVTSFATRIQSDQVYLGTVPVVCGNTSAPTITLSCTVRGYRTAIGYSVNAHGNEISTWQITTGHSGVYPNLALGGGRRRGHSPTSKICQRTWSSLRR